MGEHLLEFWRWLQNATQQAAIAEAPAVMTAAGHKINRTTNKVEYNHAYDKDVKQLRSNLTAIGEAGVNAPGAAKALELGYNIVRHPKQTYKATKHAVSYLRKNLRPIKPVYKITAENAASITPEQWTAAQDAAIARGDMAEAQRLRDLHFMAKTPNNKITSKLYHGTDATWTEYNPGFFSSGSGDNGVFGKGLYLSQYPEVSKRYGKNMMELYAYSKNPYTADRGFELFDDAAYAFNRYKNSEELFPVLKGKDAVTSPRMVMEDGWKFHYEPNEEVVIPRGEQIKSANAITYDNNGVRIPLGKRDNFNMNDIRYALFPFIGGGVGYGLYNTYDR